MNEACQDGPRVLRLVLKFSLWADDRQMHQGTYTGLNASRLAFFLGAATTLALGAATGATFFFGVGFFGLAAAALALAEAVVPVTAC